MGIILSDITNKNSTIRTFLREKFKIADIDHFVLASDTQSYEARLKFHFKKHFKNVHCSIKISQYVNSEHSKSDFVTTQKIISSAEPHLEQIFVVATYPKQVDKGIAAGYPYWGQDTAKTWAGDGDHIVTLKLRAFPCTQIEKFYIASIRAFSTGAEPVLLFGGKNNNEHLQVN